MSIPRSVTNRERQARSQGVLTKTQSICGLADKFRINLVRIVSVTRTKANSPDRPVFSALAGGAAHIVGLGRLATAGSRHTIDADVEPESIVGSTHGLTNRSSNPLVP